MYRRYALKFHKKKIEFINCVNMVERIKKARALSGGVSHLGVTRYTVSSEKLGNRNYVKLKDSV